MCDLCRAQNLPLAGGNVSLVGKVKRGKRENTVGERFSLPRRTRDTE